MERLPRGQAAGNSSNGSQQGLIIKIKWHPPFSRRGIATMPGKYPAFADKGSYNGAAG